MSAISDRLDYPLAPNFDNQVCVGGNDDTVPRVNGDTDYDLYEGMCVTGSGQIKGEVVRCDGSVITNLPFGIVRRPDGWGAIVNEPLANDVPVNVFPIGGKAKVMVPIAIAAGPVPIDDGDIIICENSGTYPGYGMKMTAALITGATNYPKLIQKIGIAQFPDDMTDGATKVRWMKVLI